MDQRLAEQHGRFVFLGLQVLLANAQERGLQLRQIDPRVVELVLPGIGRHQPPIGRHRLGMAAHAAGDLALLVQRRQVLGRFGEEPRGALHLVEGRGQIALLHQAKPDQIGRLPGDAVVARSWLSALRNHSMAERNFSLASFGTIVALGEHSAWRYRSSRGQGPSAFFRPGLHAAPAFPAAARCRREATGYRESCPTPRHTLCARFMRIRICACWMRSLPALVGIGELRIGQQFPAFRQGLVEFRRLDSHAGLDQQRADLGRPIGIVVAAPVRARARRLPSGRRDKGSCPAGRGRPTRDVRETLVRAIAPDKARPGETTPSAVCRRPLPRPWRQGFPG